MLGDSLPLRGGIAAILTTRKLEEGESGDFG